MTINVSEALDSDTASIVHYRRTAKGARVDGRWQNGAETTFKSITSVQQPTPQQLQVLPQGDRNKDVRLFISKKPLRSASDKDGDVADIALYKGMEFKIIGGGDWQEFGHSAMLGIRIK